MQPSRILRMPMSGEIGRSGVKPWRQPQKVETYKSPYGPQYKVPLNLAGIDARKMIRFGGLAGGFGAAAGVFALFFFDGVPRVKKDILQKIPIIGDFFVDEIPPEDNPF